MSDEVILSERRRHGFIVGKDPVPFTTVGKQSGIYAIFNIISGRLYVGSSSRMRRRWSEHASKLGNGRHHAAALQRSWSKHGPNVFSWEILEQVTDPACLIAREQHWIDLLGAFHPTLGMNSHPIAGSPRGAIRSAEFRAKRVEYMTGRKMPARTEEFREAMRRSQLGRKASDATKAKMSASHKGRQHSAEAVAKMRLSKLGRKMPPGFGAKISVARRAMFLAKSGH